VAPCVEINGIALHDEYFIEKKLYPNVDFYSGMTLKAASPDQWTLVSRGDRSAVVLQCCHTGGHRE
jgi:hypothetical protein